MLKVIFDIITCFLAVYGVLALTVSVFNSIRQRIQPENSGVKLVLIVKNQEGTIEGIIRNMFIGDFLRKVMSSNSITVIDLGSTDNTLKILTKLKQRYGSLDVLEQDKKEKIFTDFEEI